MTAKTKTYEITKCECGHECPIEFARIDDDAIYTCPNCYIDEVNSRIKELLPSDEDLDEQLADLDISEMVGFQLCYKWLKDYILNKGE